MRENQSYVTLNSDPNGWHATKVPSVWTSIADSVRVLPPPNVTLLEGEEWLVRRFSLAERVLQASALTRIRCPKGVPTEFAGDAQIAIDDDRDGTLYRMLGRLTAITPVRDGGQRALLLDFEEQRLVKLEDGIWSEPVALGAGMVAIDNWRRNGRELYGEVDGRSISFHCL